MLSEAPAGALLGTSGAALFASAIVLATLQGSREGKPTLSSHKLNLNVALEPHHVPREVFRGGVHLSDLEARVDLPECRVLAALVQFLIVVGAHPQRRGVRRPVCLSWRARVRAPQRLEVAHARRASAQERDHRLSKVDIEEVRLVLVAAR